MLSLLIYYTDGSSVISRECRVTIIGLSKGAEVCFLGYMARLCFRSLSMSMASQLDLENLTDDVLASFLVAVINMRLFFCL